MIHIGEAVKDGNTGEFRQIFHDFLIEAAVFNTVKEAAQHFGRIFQGFLFPHLRAFGIEEGHMGAFIVAGGFKGAPRSRRGFFKEQYDIFSFQKRLIVDPRSFLGFERCRQIQQITDFLGGEIHQCQKASSL